MKPLPKSRRKNHALCKTVAEREHTLSGDRKEARKERERRVIVSWTCNFSEASHTPTIAMREINTREKKREEEKERNRAGEGRNGGRNSNIAIRKRSC